MKTSYIARGYIAFSERDNFQNGCIGKSLHEHMPSNAWTVCADTFDGLLKKLSDEFKMTDFMLDSCDDIGRLDLQGHQLKAFSCAKPSEATITKWKAGEIDLFLTCYSFQIEIVQTDVDLKTLTALPCDSEGYLNYAN